MFRIGLIKNGKAVYLSDLGYIVKYIDGVGANIELLTSNCANGVGANIDSANKPLRKMTLKIVPPTANNDIRYDIYRLFPVGDTVTLLIATDTYDYTINAIVSVMEADIFNTSISKQAVTLTLTATQPDFLGETHTISKTVTEGTPATFTVDNDGEKTGCIITIKTNAGNSLQNPSISNDTDTMALTTNIVGGGSEFVLNTNDGEKSAILKTRTGSATFLETDVLPYRADGNTFPQIKARGVTNFTVSVSGSGSATVTLKWTRKYSFV